MSDFRFCIAPMMDWSDRHCRYLWRLLSKESRLYTEMVTTGALLHGELERFLAFDASEHPLALQLGGSEPSALAKCAKIAEQWGYDEVNLNCGCPSDRVQNGMIGACLMAHAPLVADGVKAMQDAVDIPITVKHRIGIDDNEDYEGMLDFIDTIAATGCSTFIVHARKAWLQGLSPKENREIPPLRYELVYRLKHERPDLTIIINGGIKTIEECKQHLAQVDGVMVGREAYQNPFLLADVDTELFQQSPAMVDRKAIYQEFIAYCEQQYEQGTRLHHMSRHVLGLFNGVKGARAFRRHISDNIHRQDASLQVLQDAVAFIE